MTTPTTADLGRLLPCPFCGESVEANDYRDKPACANNERLRETLVAVGACVVRGRR